MLSTLTEMDARSSSRVDDVSVGVADDHVATVTIHRPPNNYFDVGLIGRVADALDTLERESACRAVVLQSEGKHFCAGAALGDDDPDPGEPGSGHGPQLYEEAARLFAAGLPIVAAVQGAAIGGGLGLALAADFRVGTPEARFSANFARLGFHHGFALTVTLPAVVGGQRANELLLTGARIDGAEAFRIGLLDRFVPADALAGEAHRLAAVIAEAAPLASRSVRATMRAGLADRARAAMAHERAEQDRLMTTADFAEGVKAMAERRPPQFEGR
jgi:2-(1,2-epoxy-1,2-dihydrophenyl)acetyl-CoA isomerase